MRPFDGQRVLLGVTGGIASYKAVWIARLLQQCGALVDVVMTRGAQEFVGAVTFEAVTGRPVFTDLFASGHALDHIRLARDAAAILVAPATADFVARAAHGRADDLLSAILLAATCPVLISPAMNDRMWAHRQTQHNVAHLRELGYTVLDPVDGPLAVGEGAGPGRLPDPEVIVDAFARLVEPEQDLRDVRVLVTAGATREAIDPVRFLSNHSSGKMGVAIARAAWRRGATVTLVAGHTDVPLPPAMTDGITNISVTTARSMHDAVRDVLPNTDVLIMAAAPADFAPKAASDKIKKGSGVPTVELVETPDILRDTVSHRPPGMVTVGFALETTNLLEFATRKLSDKALDLIVANQAGDAGAGFGVDTNRVTVIARDGHADTWPLMSKADVADRLLDRVAELRRGR